VINIPFGEWKDFKSCVSSTMKKKGWDKERASAYCASIERTIKRRREEKLFEVEVYDVELY